MKNLFIGVDISKDVFDYCFLNEDNQVIFKGQNPNTEKGVSKFCTKIKSYKSYSPWVCLEHTGYYGYLLSFELSSQNIKQSLLNPLDLKLSMGLHRGKNDSIDAYRIASYALSNKHKLEPYKLPSLAIRKLKILLTTRNKYVQINVQLKNSLKGLKEAQKTINIDLLIKDQEEVISQMEKEVKNLEQKMIDIIKNTASLNESYQKIIKVIGVGPITAISCIVETGNFKRISKARKFSCHCGLAPFDYRSGSSVKGRTKTSPLCNKTLKGVLFGAASTAIQHDPQLKKYYKRKLEEGKHKLSVLNAVANKLVLRIFAVQMREEPFVKLAA